MQVKTITKDNFQEVVNNATVPVLIDFWASWCGPCRMLSPVVDEIAEEMADSVIVGKVNMDEESELAAKFKVMSIPTLLVFKGGKLTATSVGVKPKQEILAMLQG